MQLVPRSDSQLHWKLQIFNIVKILFSLSTAADSVTGMVQYFNWDFIAHDGKGGDGALKRLYESHTKQQSKAAKETLCSDSLPKEYVN